jgi:hypothetical protein
MIDSGYINPRTASFEFTGAPQEFVVPAGVTEITIEAWGAGSGQGDYIKDGGYAATRLSVTPGETIQINVGGSNGYNGGGSAGTPNAGGGATDVRQRGTTLDDRVLVAGGAGGPAEYQLG